MHEDGSMITIGGTGALEMVTMRHWNGKFKSLNLLLQILQHRLHVP